MPFAAPFLPILRDPPLLLAAGLLVLFGAHVASLAPYVSALAVTVFGLGDGAYSVVLMVASVVAVASSIGFGIIADQRANRRGVALATAVFLTIGTGLVPLAPKTPVFVLAHALLLPLSGSFFGQLFALARLAASLHPDPTRRAVLSTLRAMFALPWVLVLPVWALVFRAGAPVMLVYPVCLVLAVTILLCVWFWWPRDGATRWPDPKSGLTFRQSLREIWAPAILIRVLALGTIHGAITLYLVLIGLVFEAVPGRGAADTALYAGLTAGLEVPFMLALPLILGRVPQVKLIFVGAAIYAVHLAGLPFLAGTALVWVLPVFAAIGGAVVLTQPMAYLQDLMGDRPGAGASLMALQKLVGDAICATVFAAGVAVSGYGLTAATGAALSVIGAGALLVLDRRRR
ncbi:MFS transporter [Paenirhodobacter populi]|uniref:MFS transporter n=1 Tax=Paenirhodobacter populi TaxID=2306993 RepID=A0A443IZX2_9RHOB|nr:MFS transporter [Sinirhodobacter populi]RWR13710.1 hypothetical protein D2T33_04750 [Sinirhodobacter populi]